MISELRIENFAIIDHLELTLNRGLVVFTGETGAGKSIIIDAVETLLGGRADISMVRSGADRASVEGIFLIPRNIAPEVHALLDADDLIEDNAETITLGREIRANGRSVARINGRSINLNLLRTIGELLVDVHGQSEHLSLLRVSQHLNLLDSFTSVGRSASSPELTAYREIYRKLQATRHELTLLRQSESETARRTDMLNYQINEIESARIKAGEDDSLKAERNRLANAEGLASAIQEALQSIDDGSPESPSASDLLGQASRAVASLVRLDPSRSELDDQIQSVLATLSDLSASLRDYSDSIEFNPHRLDEVEERIDLLNNLKRKYARPGKTSLEDVLQFAEDARQQLEMLTHASERIKELEAQEAALLQTLGEQASALSQRRHAAAQKLEKALESELEQLSMSGARFKVNFVIQPEMTGVPLPGGQRVAFDANGIEQIEFLVAPNPGEGLKPLVKVASGGETSRLMLGIKNVLARADQVPTLIFDEIDQGIGGRVGAVVGRKLRDLSHSHQVVCITHLPQLAAFGEQHLSVNKIVQNGRTTTQVVHLDPDKRLRELAGMMGEISEGTLHSARELLETARELSAPRSRPED
jgi:DNA repair protein RecN (Recombination protein N)